MKESLEKYLKNLESKGFIKKERIGIDQVKALLTSASKNITASEKNLSIDEEACYTLAYNAMLKLARALVFLQGIGHTTDSSTRQRLKWQEKCSAKNSVSL